MKIAFFDFDGTITTKDSLPDFIKFAIGKPKYYLGLCLLSPILLAYVLKLLPNHSAKEKMISYYFKGWSEKNFQTVADEYAAHQIDKIVRPKALEKLHWHQEQGHKVVIVSASMKSWLKKWCDAQNVELISTQLEIKQGKLTGKFATKNCHGNEKVNRIKEQYPLQDYSYIYAYGDSSGDKDMLKLANEAFYKPFL